ncbi:TTN1-like protein, partial [Mya arenaria]
MLSFPAMLCHAVIWIIVFVSTNGQGTPISSQRISAMGNRRMQRLNATQQSTGTGVSSTTTPTLVPAIPRLPRRLLGRWNRRRFQDTTTNPDATTTTIGSLKAARQRQGAERKLQRRMFRRQRLREKENRLLEKIKAKTEKLLPSPPSLPSQNMLQTVDVAAGDLKNSTNSSDSSSKSQLSSWEQQKPSATSPNPVPQSTNETTSTPLVNHSNARLGLESPLHQTHSIANIGDPLVPGMELGPGESIPLGIPMNFVPVDLNPFLSNVVAKPGASDTKDRRNSLKTEDETLARFWPPRLAITSDANKGQPLLEIENETPIAGHRSGIPLGSSRRVGIKDINHFGEPLGFSKSDSPPPIKRTEFINSILGGLRQHIQFHRTHQKHGSSEPLNIDHLGAPLQPSIGHSGEPLEPTIGHPGDPLQSSFGHAGKPVPTSIGHPGEPLQPLVGDSGEPFQPSIGNPGEPLPPSIGHPGEPLPPLIGNPGEPLRPSIGHPGEPLRPSIGHPGEPLRPSIGHPGEPIRPSIGHLGEPLQPLISGSGEPLQQSISHPGEPLQPSIGHPGEPLRPSIGHHGEPLRPSIGHP